MRLPTGKNVGWSQRVDVSVLLIKLKAGAQSWVELKSEQSGRSLFLKEQLSSWRDELRVLTTEYRVGRLVIDWIPAD